MKKVLTLTILILFLSSVAKANIAFKNSTEVISDPYNKTVNPKRIPGATIRHYFHLHNTSEQVLEKSTLTASIDMKMFNIQEKSISTDMKGFVKDFEVDVDEGKVLLHLSDLAVQQKVVLYFDVIMN